MYCEYNLLQELREKEQATIELAKEMADEDDEDF